MISFHSFVQWRIEPSTQSIITVAETFQPREKIRGKSFFETCLQEIFNSAQDLFRVTQSIFLIPTRKFWIAALLPPRPSVFLLVPLGVPRLCISTGPVGFSPELWFSQTSWHLDSFISFTTIINVPIQHSITLDLNCIAPSGGYYKSQPQQRGSGKRRKRYWSICWVISLVCNTLKLFNKCPKQP